MRSAVKETDSTKQEIKEVEEEHGEMEAAEDKTEKLCRKKKNHTFEDILASPKQT